MMVVALFVVDAIVENVNGVLCDTCDWVTSVNKVESDIEVVLAQVTHTPRTRPRTVQEAMKMVTVKAWVRET